jgi:undecaprenyl-diphosphatase
LDIGHAILKGFLQGLTEFLPVSSTAHLIFTDALAKVFGWQSHPTFPAEEEFYDILLHLGTLAAVLYYFRGDLWQMLQIYLGKSTEEESPHSPGSLNLKRLPIYMTVSMAFTVGLILTMLKGSEVVMAQLHLTSPGVSDISEFYLHHPQLVAFHLMITGCLLYFTDWFSAKHQLAIETGSSQPFIMKNAIAIGIAQSCAAIFHGISRSGSTISAGLASGADRLTATRYSFLLSIPTFLMAAVYETLKLSKLGSMGHLDWPVMLVGTVISGVVGYLCVRYFIQFVARNRLTVFAIYCWVVGLGMFFFLNTVTKG